MEVITDKLFSWATNLETQALNQALATSRLPIISGHVALMPDAHYGMGSTVGSVLPTEGAIIPAAVGVDIGCVDADTEYLGPNGWRKISNWNGEQVMQFHPESGLGDLVDPLAYIERDQDEFWFLHTKYGINQMLSGDHRVLTWRPTGRDRHEVQQVVSAAEFVSEHGRLAQGNKARFETSFAPLTRTRLPLDDAQLRVQVMFMADGHLERERIGVLRFMKDRKIERARKLLDDADWVYTERRGSDGVTVFRIGRPPISTKTYANFWSASAGQLRVMAEECLHWDGNEPDRVFYTRDENSADFIQYAFTASGFRSVMRQDDRNGAIDYRVFAHTNTRVSMSGAPKTEIERVTSLDGKAYCFTVPSGFLVFRRGGNVFMTGNCGMAAVRTDLVASDLPDSLDPLVKTFEKVVPAGVGQGHEWASRGVDDWLKQNQPGTVLDNKQKATAANQLGTLGAGNHFVEVDLDEQDRVWLVLHSGSRGIGNQLALKHIATAKNVMKRAEIGLEDPELAYLLEGTPEFEAYLIDLLWAQNYARANRDFMVSAAVKALFKAVGKGRERQRINCHHNYTNREYHDGKILWITRKGAIRAAVGVEGIIPGSMGTSTFIVKGLGNPDSFDSCSHGAGRVMSRNKARKELSPESLIEAMGDRAWNKDSAAKLVDEHPSSYKDIHEVMRNQADLVEITNELNQIANYKGTR